MVAGVIAVGLMVGLSTFFAGGFKSILQTREKVSDSQEQFDMAKNLTSEFSAIHGLDTNNTCNDECVVALNDMEDGNLPFTYIGTDRFDKIVVRDFFVFNGKGGTTSSQNYSPSEIKNPGGITELSGKYYVTAPLENDIYECNDSTSGCNLLGIANLNHPIDITDNDTNTLYVTDAGNNRIIQIENPTSTKDFSEVMTGLNYPTGIELYSYDGTDYLFVADTYNHLVKKITLTGSDAGAVTVVIGDGDDEVCDPSDGRDHSARYCKLNFPTGLMIHNDELYISDTGNGRVLKVSDPNTDLTDYKILATTDGNIEILNIDFVFPSGTAINSVAEGPGKNNVHKGRYEIDGPIARYHLSASMIEDFTELECVGIPTCITKKFLRGFDITPEDNLFEVGDNIDIEGDFYSISASYNLNPSTDRVEVSPNNTQNFYNDGTSARIKDTFSGIKTFYLDLTDIDFGSTFNFITSEIYDQVPALNSNPPDSLTIRIGDGELGTSEDTIEVLPGSYDFPTGLGWNGSTIDVSASLEYSTDFTNYDYTSDFEVINFEFTKKNGGDLLELGFEAMTGKDSGGTPIWDNFTFNADITL